jgi:hypothetical protein
VQKPLQKYSLASEANTLTVQPVTGPILRKIFLKINALDRRISVAPMMDWTDQGSIILRNKRLWDSKSLVAFW